MVQHYAQASSERMCGSEKRASTSGNCERAHTGLGAETRRAALGILCFVHPPLWTRTREGGSGGGAEEMGEGGEGGQAEEVPARARWDGLNTFRALAFGWSTRTRALEGSEETWRIGR